MAVSIARWLFSEAQSGTGPTTVVDDTNNSNDLTIDYSSGDAVWGGSAAGNFLDYTAAVATANTAKCQLTDVANNGNIGTSLDGVTQCSFIAVVNMDTGSALGSRIFHVGTDTGNGEIALVADAFSTIVRISGSSVADFPDLGGQGLTVVIGVIDTTEAVQADRVKVWYDGVAQTAGSPATVLNDTIDCNSATFSACVGNRPSADRNMDGRVHYLELFSDKLTAQEVTDATTNLLANNDVPALDQTGRSITNIDGDNIVSAGQSATITGIGFDLPISTVTLGGESLTVTGTPTTTSIDVTVPTGIDLKWSELYQLAVTDNTGTITRNSITLAPQSGWSTQTYNGTAPNPTTTESFYEYAQTDATVGNITMASGDVLAWEAQTGMTVDGQTIPVISPAATVTGAYRIWDDTLQTWSSESTFTITDGTFMRANYTLNVTDDYLYAGGGESRAPGAILFCGDSNTCGDGGGVLEILDKTIFDIYTQNASGNTLVDTSATPYIEHAQNSGADEVGPDLHFCDAIKLNKYPYRKIIALGAGDSGSGFTSSQWQNSLSLWNHAKTLGDTFHSENTFGKIIAVQINIGTNDINDYSPVTLFTDEMDDLIGDIRSGMFTIVDVQPDLNTVPIVLNGVPPEFLPGDPGKDALQAELTNYPASNTYTGFADITGMRSQVGDLIHVAGADNRFYGKVRGWAAFQAAEANT